MFSDQGVELSERNRRTRKCGLVGGDVTLLEEVCHCGVSAVSKAHARSSLSRSACGSGCKALSDCSSACMHAAKLSAMRMDQPSETASKPLVRCLLLQELL